MDIKSLSTQELGDKIRQLNREIKTLRAEMSKRKKKLEEELLSKDGQQRRADAMKSVNAWDYIVDGDSFVSPYKMKKFYKWSRKGGLPYNEFILAILEHYPNVRKLDCGTMMNINLLTAYIPPENQKALLKI